MDLPVPVALFVPNPTLTSVTPTGGAAAAYSYKLVAVAVDGTQTAASAAVSDAVGPTTLDNTHFETLVWTDPANTDHVLVYRTVGGLTQGLIATVAAGVGTYADKGALGDGSTPSAVNGTGYGAAIAVGGVRDLTVQADGTFTATIQLQGRIGSGAWVSIGAAITGAGFTDATATAKALSQLRARMTAFSSGAPALHAAGN